MAGQGLQLKGWTAWVGLLTLTILLLSEPVWGAPPESKEGESLAFVIEDSVAGEWRGESNRARDPWRHPTQTLTFFGLEPEMTVVEVSPGRGWYTEILAPYLNRNGGAYLAAGYAADDDRAYAQRSRRAFQKNYVDQPDVYGPIEVTVLNDAENGIAPAGSADLVLTFRNVHNWVPAGTAEAVFAEFFRALRPGGVLGVVDHRLPAEVKADPDLSTGYIHEDTVIDLAKQAGFVLEGRSEVNANPADTADHPFGVWTLKPTALTAPFRSPKDPDFDRAPYDAIGESDRFTLRFRKPLD